MSGHLLLVSVFGAVLCFSLSLDVPLPAAILVRGEPVGFSVSPHKQKRSAQGNVTEEEQCAEDYEYRHERLGFCCKKCFSGYHKKVDCAERGQSAICVPCAKGSFMAARNFARSCRKCAQCKPQLGQVELAHCTQEKDTVCGCPVGQFQVRVALTFKCQNCSRCQNGTELSPCHGYNDSLCSCFHGFFFDQTYKLCRSCDVCNHPGCQLHCPAAAAVITPPVNQGWSIPFYVVGILGAVVVTGAVIGITCYLMRRRATPNDDKGSSLQETPLIIDNKTSQSLNPLPGSILSSGVETQLNEQNLCQPLPLPDCITSAHGAQRMDRPAQLYVLIDNIPSKSWKEFVRRLGLSDNDIENSERENKRYRDAQYDMLRVWMSRFGPSVATRDLISRVLRDMELGGCIERIQECA